MQGIAVPFCAESDTFLRVFIGNRGDIAVTEFLRRKWIGSSVRKRVAVVMLLAVCVGFVAYLYAADTDGDGLPDAWEQYFFGHLGEVAGGDPDHDGLTNAAEYAENTDPIISDTDCDGWFDGVDADPLSRVHIDWGEPAFTIGDDHVYPAPDWFISAFRVGGEWQTNDPTAWRVAATNAATNLSLNIEVDRALLTNDAVLEIQLFDSADGGLVIDLYDANAQIIA